MGESIISLDYATENSFIRGVTFLPYTVAKKEGSFLPEKAMIGDEIIDRIELDTKGKVNRKDIFLFQKLLYVFMFFQKKRVCLHSQQYVMIRDKNNYTPISKSLNLSQIEKVVDCYVKMKASKMTFSGGGYILIKLPFCFFNLQFLKMIVKIFKIVFQFVFHNKDHHCIDKDYLAIQVETCCAPPQMDYRVVSHCTTGWIYKDAKGKLYRKNNCSSLMKKLWMG